MLWHLMKTSNRFCFPVSVRRRGFSTFILIVLTTIITFGNSCNMKKTEYKNAPHSNDTSKVGSSFGDPQTVHRRAIAIDLHADSIQRALDEGLDLGQRLPDGHFDSARAIDGGLDAQFFSIWVEPALFGGGGSSAMERADKQIAAVRTLTERYPETWELAITAANVRSAAAAGKLAALLGLEGGYAIDER